MFLKTYLIHSFPQSSVILYINESAQFGNLRPFCYGTPTAILIKTEMTWTLSQRFRKGPPPSRPSLKQLATLPRISSWPPTPPFGCVRLVIIDIFLDIATYQLLPCTDVSDRSPHKLLTNGAILSLAAPFWNMPLQWSRSRAVLCLANKKQTFQCCINCCHMLPFLGVCGGRNGQHHVIQIQILRMLRLLVAGGTAAWRHPAGSLVYTLWLLDIVLY